ncbi:MAG: mechanosensitive ion channel [Planctomycetes bacterium]|nr:mechanosensitive ion channel [Planctomycetota bacterium]
MPRALVAFAFSVLFSVPHLPAADAPAPAPAPAPGALAPWKAEKIDAEGLKEIEAEAARAREELGTLPASPAEGSPEAQLATLLRERVDRLQRLAEVVRSAEAFRRGLEDLPKRKAEWEAALKALPPADAEPPPLPPDLTEESLKGLVAEAEGDLLKAQDAEQAVRERRKTAEARLKEIPALDEKLRTRVDALRAKTAGLEADLAAAVEEPARRAARLRLENNEIDLRVSEEERDAQAAELKWLQASALASDVEAELAARRVAIARKMFEARQRTYSDALDRRQKEIERQKLEAEQARDPLVQFRARSDAEIQERGTRNEQDQLRLKAIEDANRTLRADLDKRRESFRQLQEFVDKYSGTETASARLQLAYARIRVERERMEREIVDDEWRPMLDEVREELPIIEDRLGNLDEQAQKWKADLAGQIRPERRSDADAVVDDVRRRLREVLRQRLSVLEAIHNALVDGEGLRLQREADFESEARYLTAKVFWIRDAVGVGPALLRTLVTDDRERLGIYARKSVSWFGEALRAPAGMPLVLLLCGAVALLPIAVVWLRKRIARRLAGHRPESGSAPPPAAPSPRASYTLAREFLALISAALLPACLAVLGGGVTVLGLLPPDVEHFASVVLLRAAYVLFIWKAAMTLFRPEGPLPGAVGMAPETADAIRAIARWVGIATLALWVPGHSVRESVSGFAAIPRVLFLSYEASLVLLAARILRRESVLSRLLLKRLHVRSILRRNWSILAWLGTAALAGLVVLDGAGYRFGARRIFLRIIESAAVLGGLAIVYGLLIRVLEAAHTRAQRRGAGIAPPGPSAPSSTPSWGGARPSIVLSTRRFLRVVFVLLAAYIIANRSGLLPALQGLLESVGWTVDRSGETAVILSLWDISIALLVLFGTGAVLRELPGVYETLVYPRTRWDPGLRYAVLAISRYAIGTGGVLAALSAVHLGISKIQWILAAASVGLGFGLQEIVANFVSGIILLVERPIRVGDIVSVGDVSGQVERINIRATAITNWDRQTVLVPNKEFITGKLTNWTYGDLVVRTTISVGAAYGTDPEKVRAILLEVADAHRHVLKTPPPAAFFMGFGDSSLDFVLFVFVPAPAFRFPVQNDLNGAIARRFQEEGIEIPFPQRDVYLRPVATVRREEGRIESGGESAAESGGENEGG